MGTGRDRDAGRVLVTYHLGHGQSAPPRDGIQERLGHAVSDGGMERVAVDGERIHLARNITERRECAAAQQGCHMTLDRIDGRTCRVKTGSRPPTPEYCTAAQSP